MTIVERRAGLIDAPPDAAPVIPPVAALPGFFLAGGFSGRGFTIGPATGRSSIPRRSASNGWPEHRSRAWPALYRPRPPRGKPIEFERLEEAAEPRRHEDSLTKR